ncbi:MULTISPECIES: carbonic anhydrase [unclassified Stappia]|uniref:carbonic anhydrase n=1 Tax=unclassified Stappia TaxID=2629676 RepID=UPI001643DE22|nr:MULTISPECIES: carbonic anhydrase [unclassified Stappia]
MCEIDHYALSRRGLLGLGAAAATTAFAGGFALPGSAAAEQATSAPNDISPEDALARLVEGNSRYVANAGCNGDFSVGRAARAGAQYPFAGILSCADSRVAPELLFDQGPGELFVMRVAGNFVDISGLASIEYGVAVLGIPLLVVMGHTNCGAVSATIRVVEEGTELPGHLPELVGMLKPGVEAALADKPADPLAAATRANVLHNVEKLKAAGPIVAEAVAGGKVRVVGALYDIATGKVEVI